MPEKEKKILIVEDDKFLRDLLERKLVQAGYKVITAVDGEDGLKAAKEEKPDLILLDIILPTMSGWEVLEKIKADPDLSSIAVIVLSNLGEREDVERGLSLGAEDYIIKAHFTPSEVIDKAEQCLSSRK
jgi:DNA-binding response OmpR family regulator